MEGRETEKSRVEKMPAGVRIGWIFLLGAFVVQGLVGYSVALGLDTRLWAWHQGPVAEALWGDRVYGVEVAAYRAWVAAVLGGTIASFALAMVWIVAVPMRRREPWAWWAVLTSTLAWFWIDTAISARHGVAINVGFNVGALLMLAIPFALTWPWRRRRRGGVSG